jgi:hypothetical protein
VCAAQTPVGVFCGHCGAHLHPQPGDGPRWLRPRAFCAAPEEHVLRPAISSTLFPHTSQLSRGPFTAGLVLIVAIMAVAVELRLPGALIAVATLGLPLLFGIYSHASGIDRDIPRPTLLLTAALGVAIGVGWVLLTGDLVIRETGAAFDAGMAGNRVVRNGLGVTEGSALLMLLPALVIRLVRPGQRESLQGFAIGVLGALSFTAAATFTKLAPQFAAGPVAADQTVEWLLVEAGIRGLAIPLTAACAGGLVGAALWFTRPREGPRLSRPAVVGALFAVGAVVLTIYAIIGVVDVAGVPQMQMLGWYVAMALVALIALRIGIQLALLHEAPDPCTEQPELCASCRNVVPHMGFCPLCGTSAHASSHTSAAERRRVTPVQDGQRGTGALWPGYAVPARAYTVAPLTATPFMRVLAVWVVTIVGVSAALVGLSASIATPAVQYNCPPDCGHPPIGTPVTSNPRFTAADGSFSVAYPAPGSAYEVSIADDGVTARYLGGDGGVLRLWSQPAQGRSAKETTAAILAASYPNARRSYAIPNAMVGFRPGYGEVADIWPQDGDSRFRHLRLVILVSVHNDLALVAGAIGPYRQFGPDFGPGRPSAANLELALDMGQYVNSFAWQGDPPR